MDDNSPLFPQGKRPPPPPPKAKTEIVKAEPSTRLTKTFLHRLESHMIDTAVKAIEMGLPLRSVSGLLRVSHATFIKWREMGSDPKCTDPVLVEFAVAVEEARSKASLNGVQNLQVHAGKDWRAQVALLQAQDPDVWVQTTKSKVEVVAGVKDRDLSKLTDEELEELNRLENKLEAK